MDSRTLGFGGNGDSLEAMRALTCSYRRRQYPMLLEKTDDDDPARARLIDAKWRALEAARDAGRMDRA